MIKAITQFLSRLFSHSKLVALVKVQQQEIDALKSSVKYVTLATPDVDTLNAKMTELFYDKTFSFILLALENEIFQLFRDGKGEDIYRGGLIAIDRLKKDMELAAQAAKEKAKKNNG